MSKKDPSVQEMVEDFKQYVDTVVSREVRTSEHRIKKDLRKEIKESAAEIKDEVRAGIEGVGDAIQQNQDDIDNHERRITTLEAA